MRKLLCKQVFPVEFIKDKFMEKKAGYSLILALIILSIILSGSAILGRIVISNLRQGRLIDESMVAAWAAWSGLEKGIYLAKQDPENFVPSNEKEFLDENKTAGFQIFASLKGDDFLKLSQNDFWVWHFSDNSVPEKINISWEKASDCPTSSLEVIRLFSDSSNNFVSDRQILDASTILNLKKINGETENMENKVLKELRIKSLFCDIKNLRVLDDQGQPLPSRLLLKSVGEYRGTKKAFEASLPLRKIAHNFFDFAIFSECSLNKKTGDINCPDQ